jgi:outer membrane beta-barrel protein
MKQARRWLLTAAIVLLPSVGLAQKPKPPAGGKPPNGAKPPTAAPAGSAGVQSADDDQPKPAGSADTTPAAPTGPDTGAPSDDVCAITPDAPQCKGGGPGKIDLGKEAKKQFNAEIYAVQQIYALRYHRVELQPYYSTTLNDQFVTHPAPGLAINYYITNVLAVGVNGNLYAGQNVDSDFNFQNRRATRVAVPLNEYQWGANLNFTYVPMYGKFAAGFGDFIFHYDAYLVGGLGAISTRPLAVIDPDNRKFPWKPKIDFNLGIGLRIFVNRWLGVTAEIRDYIYNEALENTKVANGPLSNPSDPNSPANDATWYGENRLTNNVQAQIGLSIFLPFSWEYRLPK